MATNVSVWPLAIAFYGRNGFCPTPTNDGPYEFVMALPQGDLEDIGPLAERLAAATREHHRPTLPHPASPTTPQTEPSW